MSSKSKATVKWFDNAKGFGFLSGPNGDVFVHYRSILSVAGKEYKTLTEGDQVEFLAVKTDKGWSAAEVVRID